MISEDRGRLADPVALVSPDLENLSGFEAALAAGWSPDPRRAGDQTFIHAQLQALRQDRTKFLDALIKAGGGAGLRLDSHLFFIWDGEFCGAINLRFLPGTEELPPDVSGHVGYSVVAWKQGRGYATAALRLLLAVARNEGLARLMILCNEDIHASQRVIEKACGEFFMHGPHSSDRPEQVKLYFWLRTTRQATG